MDYYYYKLIISLNFFLERLILNDLNYIYDICIFLIVLW